jgi:hypothetical protein
MNKKIVIGSLLVIAVIAALGITFKISMAQTTTGQGALVTPADLAIAGYTNPRNIVPASGRYVGAYYFNVDEKATSSTSEAPNLVLVSDEQVNYVRTALSFTYGTDDHDFAIDGGIGREGTMADGRTVIYFDKGKSYIVIVAPNKQDTEKLALLIASKITAD